MQQKNKISEKRKKEVVIQIGAKYPDMESALEFLRGLPSETRKRIELPSGDFVLSKPILLDRRDSGLMISGAKDGNTRLLGGIRLKNWKKEGAFFSLPVPERIRPRMFLVGNDFVYPTVHRKLACLPETGVLTHQSRFDGIWLSSTNGGFEYPPTEKDLTEMIVDPADLPEDFEPENADILVYHVWDDSLAGIRDYDSSTGEMRLASPLANPAGSHNQHRYSILNTKTGMGKAGNWYHDRRNGKIVYHPYPSETLENIESAWIPCIDHIFKLEDGADDVTIEDLGIFLANAPVANAGLRCSGLSGAVEVKNCRNLTLRRLRIAAVAGNAIHLSGVSGYKVEDCRIERTGGGGIIAEGCLPGEITGNEVIAVGQLYYSAVSIMAGGRSQFVWVFEGKPEEKGSVRIADNFVDHSPYCGIVCCGGPHRIENNEVTQVMLKLHDGAAIYCSRSGSSVLRGNFVHDFSEGNGYYFDEGCHDCLLEGNISLRCRIPLLCHIALNNMFRNNVFLNGGELLIAMPRSRGAKWENMIVYAGGDITFGYHYSWSTYYPPEEITTFENSYLYSRSGKIRMNRAEELPEYPGLIRRNPCVCVDKNGNTVFRAGSPVLNKQKTLFHKKKALTLPIGWSVF